MDEYLEDIVCIKGKLIDLGILRTDPKSILLYTNWLNSEELRNWIGYGSRIMNVGQVAKKINDAVELNGCLWSIFEKNSRRLIGTCSCIMKNGTKNVYLDVCIGHYSDRNKGYGKEAISLAVKYAFENMNAHNIAVRINSENTVAIQCFNACGFIECGRMHETDYFNGHYSDAIIMEILKRDWLSKKSVKKLINNKNIKNTNTVKKQNKIRDIAKEEDEILINAVNTPVINEIDVKDEIIEAAKELVEKSKTKKETTKKEEKVPNKILNISNNHRLPDLFNDIDINDIKTVHIEDYKDIDDISIYDKIYIDVSKLSKEKYKEINEFIKNKDIITFYKFSFDKVPDFEIKEGVTVCNSLKQNTTDERHAIRVICASKEDVEYLQKHNLFTNENIWDGDVNPIDTKNIQILYTSITFSYLGTLFEDVTEIKSDDETYNLFVDAVYYAKKKDTGYVFIKLDQIVLYNEYNTYKSEKANNPVIDYTIINDLDKIENDIKDKQAIIMNMYNDVTQNKVNAVYKLSDCNYKNILIGICDIEDLGKAAELDTKELQHFEAIKTALSNIEPLEDATGISIVKY